MVCYAVIDTNVFVAALLSKRADSATVRVLGNQKHYPIKNFIVTPAEMMEIIDK